MDQKTHRLASLSALLVFSSFATAQESRSSLLINTETNRILPQGRWELDADLRLFGGDEKNLYASGGAYFGLGNRLGASLKFSGASIRTDGGIRHGGSEIEAQLRVAIDKLPGLTASAGIVLPNTVSREKPYFVASASYRIPTPVVATYIGARAAFSGGERLTTITGGIEAPISPGWTALADLSVPVRGTNAVSTSTGDRIKQAVYGVGIRYAPIAWQTTSASFTLGLTNGLGTTTGFGSGAALGSSTAVYFGVSFRG